MLVISRCYLICEIGVSGGGSNGKRKMKRKLQVFGRDNEKNKVIRIGVVLPLITFFILHSKSKIDKIIRI